MNIKKGIIGIFKLLFYTVGRLPIKKNTIVFESFLGKQFSDNPKALYDYIKNNYPNYKLYWSFDRKYKYNFSNHDLNVLPRFSLKWIFVMARAQYWITNSRLPLWIPKLKHTIYVQTWHGTPLKKLGTDINKVQMPGTNTQIYKNEFIEEANKWDYLISPNSYSTTIFKSAFEFDKTIIESGYPRNDILYLKNTPKEIKKYKEKMNIPFEKKVILYAPTWRDNDYYTIGKYKFSLKLDLAKIKEEFGNDYIVILRMHYLVAESFDLRGLGDFVYDFSYYNDISDLYLISDLLITDYSSVFFDYANLKKPILFYTYDIESYRDKLRGFYFDFEQEAPGPLLTTTEEIMYYLRLINNNQFQLDNEFEKFYNKFCYLEDGRASQRVIEAILEG
ncbi:CDP-glycerol glycerophosphotransferase family protein [Virgibacillus dakarensis]|uniref:CDP-glycerol glycerophosphotransferase family protein n=1 Tax=Virgibacillus dakarensis TaxID=1917889 RepID=UPI000B452C86|nr:CDP-glycerol glycerophosphotransferase family protein [Virgibacillus dakarensis]